MAGPPPPVIIAKNVLVWLSQLSATSGRDITTLDAIPDQELDLLCERGFTVIWLIGVWERSRASAALKAQSGILKETSSAYCIRDYRIDRSIGGRAALENLKRRCRPRNIRLACDFVPNHDAMDSVWMRDHPERFVSSSDPPFQNYSYTGQDLSSESSMKIFIEDGYADQSDAAVAFQRVDHQGKVRYVYHGNDGTGLPWNDTAQIDLSQKIVREAIIERLMSVASIFPIIRIDSAMTTARKQFRRLWFPTPGDSECIPSRQQADKANFDRVFPKEFWPEAISRLEKERPGTLLIGEVMWTLEPYFLRDMGFHTVYDNEDMPSLASGAISALKESLKSKAQDDSAGRFIHFLQNPDKPPVAESLGTGDRYFGLCSVLATLPGIPLFGHGQIEGSHTAYSMSSYTHEKSDLPDIDVLVNHEERIVPLLKKRSLFAESRGFRILKFDGEDARVLAYENSSTDHVVFVFNDSDHPVNGFVRGVLSESDDNDENSFIICHDLQSDDRILLSQRSLAENGIPIHLKPYGSAAYIGFSQSMKDHSGLFTLISRQPRAQSESSLSIASSPIIRQITAEVCADQDFRRGLFRAEHGNYQIDDLTKALLSGNRRLGALAMDYAEISRLTAGERHQKPSLISALELLPQFAAVDAKLTSGPSGYFRRIYGLLPHAPAVLSTVAVLSHLRQTAAIHGLPSDALVDVEATRPIADYLRAIAGDEAGAIGPVLQPLIIIGGDIAELLREKSLMAYLKIHTYDGVLWLDKDRFGDLVWWTYTITLLSNLANCSIKQTYTKMLQPCDVMLNLLETAENAEYRYDEILRFVDDPGNGHAPTGTERPG